MPLSAISRLLSALALSLALVGPVKAESLAGAYLAARHADYAGDFTAMVKYGARALAHDPDNLELMEGLLVAKIGLGQFEQAVPVARRLQGLTDNNQIAGLALLANAIQAKDWEAVQAALEAGTTIGEVLDNLVRGWALVGLGQAPEALQTFATMDRGGDPGQFATYHRALALAYTGDYEGAAELFSGATEGTLRLDRSGVLAYVQILSQLERNPAAVELLDAAFPEIAAGDGEAELVLLRAELAAGKPIDFTVIASPRDALADVFASVAQTLASDLDANVVLLYSRTAEFLNPDRFEATLLSARLLEIMEHYDLAVATYGQVPADHRLFLTAALSRAEALRRWGKMDDAVAMLQDLAQSHPEHPGVFETLGDTLRFQGEYGAALLAYDKALALLEEPSPADWGLFFARGITNEREGNWPAAEADFRKSLELNPEHPSVLNYLGYSLVERRENLEEALDMIERAVTARPGDGYIIDSLGWVLYRLGRYEEAVAPMERAVELMPMDPVVNDHLGDVYWAVGRQLEAKFQWRRALSFITDDTDAAEIDPDRIRRKLEVGLDVVLEEESAPPLTGSDESN